jgi:periplasmic protein TonB
MLRSTSLGLSPLALGVSLAVHAAMVVASVPHASTSSTGPDQVVTVEMTADPAPDPDATFAPAIERAAKTPESVRSNVLSTSHAGPKPERPLSAPAPVGLVLATDDTPIFTMAIGGATDGAGGVVSPSGTALPRDGALLPEDAVDVRARLVLGLPPAYPAAARAEGVEGDVVLELIVGLTGAVESAQVVRGMGHGLEAAALRAARAFRFTPAIKAGRPVRVRLPWPVRFRLE